MSFQTGPTVSQSIDTGTTLATPLNPASQSTHTQTRPHLFFIDHLRVVLTMLVIAHHLALTYGALGSWYYQEKSSNAGASLLLSVFVLINQAFFMGCFFLLSGYFTPRSYDRKGSGMFLKDRLLRLGIPLICYSVLIDPLTYYIGAGEPMPYWQYLSQHYLIGPGPLWFVEALLLFAGVYALWRWMSRKQITSAPSSSKPLTYRAVVVFTLVLSVVNVLVRIVFPMGWSIPVFNLQVAYLPQYIGMFIVGIIAYRRNWFLTMPSAMGKVGLGVALGATIVLFPLTILVPGGIFVPGIHWQATLYAFWDSILCVGLSMGLLVFFRQRFNRQGRLMKLLSEHAYTVYIIHAPIIVCLALMLQSVQVSTALKFVLALVIAVPLCFVCGWLLRKLPFARRIL